MSDGGRALDKQACQVHRPRSAGNMNLASWGRREYPSAMRKTLWLKTNRSKLLEEAPVRGGANDASLEGGRFAIDMYVREKDNTTQKPATRGSSSKVRSIDKAPKRKS